MKTGIVVIALIVSACVSAQSALAGSVGLRAGFGINPDQVVVGAQGQLSGKKLKAFSLAPSVDFGFGDNITTICGNVDFLLDLPLPGSEGGFYAGLGPTLTYWDFKNIASDTEIGLSLVGGIRFGLGTKNAYNAEVRFGVGDVPDVRVLFGILFGARKGNQWD
jgi:hypothetical protein